MDIRRLQGDVSFNVSMYDELFDSSLDEKGVDHVINILKERLEKYNECMYVISHRKESVNFTTQAEIRDGEIIYLQKENGITTRIPFNREMKV
jgi:ABC-type lipoprotein export system ATPase subunit